MVRPQQTEIINIRIGAIYISMSHRQRNVLITAIDSHFNKFACVVSSFREAFQKETYEGNDLGLNTLLDTPLQW